MLSFAGSERSLVSRLRGVGFLCLVLALQGGVFGVQSQETPSTQKKERYAKNLARWKAMSDSEREEARERFRRWNALSDSQQSELAKKMAEYRSFSGHRKRSFQRLAKAYFAATPLDRRKLEQKHEVWSRFSPEKRFILRAALDGIHGLPADHRKRWNSLSLKKKRGILRRFFRTARSDQQFDLGQIVRKGREEQDASMQRFFWMNRHRLSTIFESIGRIPGGHWKTRVPFPVSPELHRGWRRLSEVERWEIRRRIESQPPETQRADFERILRETVRD